MKIFNPLRQLARSSKWQILYARSKEMSNINIFKNTSDFTPIQVAFLQWLEIYHSMEIDLAMKEKHISREVIDDDYRADAYLKFKNADKKFQKKEPKEGYEPVNVPSVMFKRGSK